MKWLHVLYHSIFLGLFILAYHWAVLRTSYNLAAVDLSGFLEQGPAYLFDLPFWRWPWLWPTALASSCHLDALWLFRIYSLSPIVWAYALFILGEYVLKFRSFGFLILWPLAGLAEWFFDAGQEFFIAWIFVALAIKSWQQVATRLKTPAHRFPFFWAFGASIATIWALLILGYQGFQMSADEAFRSNGGFYYHGFLSYLSADRFAQWLLVAAFSGYGACRLWILGKRRLVGTLLALVFINLIALLFFRGYALDFEGRYFLCLGLFAFFTLPFLESVAIKYRCLICFAVGFYAICGPIRHSDAYFVRLDHVSQLTRSLAQKPSQSWYLPHSTHNVDSFLNPDHLEASTYALSHLFRQTPQRVSVLDSADRHVIHSRLWPYTLKIDAYCGAEIYRSDQGLAFLLDQNEGPWQFGNLESRVKNEAYKGRFACVANGEHLYTYTINIPNIQQSDSLYVEIWRKGSQDGHLIITTQDINELYVCEQETSAPDSLGWQKLSARVKITERIGPLRIYAYNEKPQNGPVCFDDLRIRVFSDYP